MADQGLIGWFNASNSRAQGQDAQTITNTLSKVNAFNYFVPLVIANDLSSTLKKIYNKTVPAYLGGYSDTQVVGMSVDYSITGTVTDPVNAPVANAIVRLYYRPNGVMVREVRTNGSGVYTFSEIPNLSQIFYLIAFDPTGTTNIGRLDRMTAG